jgi:uncharacterized protein (DUF305 family)
MSHRLVAWSVLAVLLVLVTTSCRSTGATQRSATQHSTTQPAASSEATPASPTATTAELEALYWARKDSARAQFTEADVRFMRMMITHHAQALTMSALALTNGASRAVQTLAARITNAQKDEIAAMQRWLRVRDLPVPTIEMEGTALRVNGMSVHGMDMAGILTQAQIDSLAAAEGTTFDRLFLTYMIEHHRGAVAMVETLFEADGAAQDPAIFRLASDINADQTTEIERMNRMLDDLPGTASRTP